MYKLKIHQDLPHVARKGVPLRHTLCEITTFYDQLAKKII
jgi:hypothetical protein